MSGRLSTIPVWPCAMIRLPLSSTTTATMPALSATYLLTTSPTMSSDEALSGDCPYARKPKATAAPIEPIKTVRRFGIRPSWGSKVRRQYLFVDKLTWWAENLSINSAGFEFTTFSFGFLQSAEVYDEH